MITLAIVPLIVWLGVFAFMLSVDRKLSAAEARHRDDDL